MNLKALLLALLTTQCLYPTCGQQVVDNICIQVIGSNGLSAAASGKRYDATLGEVAIASLHSSDDAFGLTQGFHQPECAKISVSTQDFAPPWELILSPNPALEYFQLAYLRPEQHEIEVRIWSMTGLLVTDWKKLPAQSRVDCSTWATGVYSIEIKDPESGQRTISKLLKLSL